MKWWLLSFTALMLVSCTLGPDYKRPVVDVPTDWRWKKAEPRDEANKGPWWDLFHDPQLTELEVISMQNNQDLKAALARVEQARAAARISQADFYPTLTGNPSWERQRTSKGAFQPSSTYNTTKVPFDLSYEIDLWGKVRRGFEAQKEEALSSLAAYRNTMFSLQANVAAMYYQLRLEDREIEILEQTVHWRDNALKIAQGRFGAGLDNQLPVFQAQTELSSSQADLAAAKQRRASDQDALAVLCGVPTGEFTIAPAVMDFAPPKMEPGLPSELLERRPDVAAAERHLAAQNAKIGVAYAEFFPSISLTASGGYQSAALENIFDWRSTVWSFGPSISFPIFTGGRDKASLNSLKSAYEEAVAQYRQSILVAFQDVDDALAELKFLDEQAEARHMGLEASKAAAEMASTRYKNGAVNYLDVIDAERTRLDNELQMAQIDEQRMVATVQLIKAIGGGWDINPNPKKDVKQKGVVLQKLSETQ